MTEEKKPLAVTTGLPRPLRGLAVTKQVGPSQWEKKSMKNQPFYK